VCFTEAHSQCSSDYKQAQTLHRYSSAAERLKHRRLHL